MLMSGMYPLITMLKVWKGGRKKFLSVFICYCELGLENSLFVVNTTIKLVLKYINHWRWNYNEFLYVDSSNHGLIPKEQNSVEWKEIWPRVEVGSHIHFIKQLWWNPDLISLPDKQQNSYELQGVHDFILSSNLEENRTNQFLGNSNKVLFNEIH